MKVCFRVDSSKLIGSGHLVRCLTLAKALRKSDSEICFISRNLDNNLNYLIKESDFELFELAKDSSFSHEEIDYLEVDDYSSWIETDIEKDYSQTVEIIEDQNIELLIVDHYSIDDIWEKAVGGYVRKIMVIDDLENRKHVCDYLLDQNFSLNLNRYANLVPSGCQIFLGPKYAILDSSFATERKKISAIKAKVDRIFVFFGGSDPEDYTTLSIKSLLRPSFEDMVIDVVVGKKNINLQKIEDIAKKNQSVNLHIQIDYMAKLMSYADAALGAGGTNTWERMCLGLPTLLLPIASNQLPTLEALTKSGVVSSLNTKSKPTSEELYVHLKSFCSDREKLFSYSKKSMELVDGLGTSRIIGKIS